MVRKKGIETVARESHFEPGFSILGQPSRATLKFVPFYL